MAGSYDHVTTKKGKLRNPKTFSQMIENLGDAYEAIEEMYGMIQILAEDAANEQSGAQADRNLFIQSACDRYKEGLRIGGVQREK